jgi:excisionase family DNA binding protein
MRTDGMLTYDDVAKKFGVSVKTVRRWVARGKLKAVRMSRNSVFFRPIQVDLDMARRETK